MAKIVNKLTELIGNTPLLALNKFSAERGLKTPVLAKVEYFNPGGSVKDRIALAMIEDAEAKGTLKARSNNHRTNQWKHRCWLGFGVCSEGV